MLLKYASAGVLLESWSGFGSTGYSLGTRALAALTRLSLICAYALHLTDRESIDAVCMRRKVCDNYFGCPADGAGAGTSDDRRFTGADCTWVNTLGFWGARGGLLTLALRHLRRDPWQARGLGTTRRRTGWDPWRQAGRGAGFDAVIRVAGGQSDRRVEAPGERVRVAVGDERGREEEEVRGTRRASRREQKRAWREVDGWVGHESGDSHASWGNSPDGHADVTGTPPANFAGPRGSPLQIARYGRSAPGGRHGSGHMRYAVHRGWEN